MDNELTPSAILRQFNQTGKVPESMLPLVVGDNFPEEEDPTRPLRGAFEGILLARTGHVAIHVLSQRLVEQRDKPWVKHYMLPVSEIDEEDSIEARVELLRAKRSFVMKLYEDIFKQSLSRELDKLDLDNLPPKIRCSYERLAEISSRQDQVSSIISATESFYLTVADLFRIAGYDYPRVLGYDPTAREMVSLVEESYNTYVHPQTGIHQQVDTGIGGSESVLGEKYTINVDGVHRVVLIDLPQYHRKEREMRATGAVKSQRIHCPFAMDSQFTAPFLDNPAEAFETNPLQHTFETLVRDYIGS